MMHGLFEGHFMYSDVAPRSRAIDAARITIEAPATLDLQVGTTGPGIVDAVETDGTMRRHTVTISPTSYQPEEAGAVSPIDRDPVLLVSTFKSYEELGRAYAAAAFPKIAVTPELVALADEITLGIDDRRAQAAAIDSWMKTNIRYVAIYLSIGRVVPNDAMTVWKNKFGDCKDKATLMAALLAAKGITSEAALINLGTAYTLPEPPTLAALNHVILYLPEFDLYDDPTAGLSTFGVLALEAYDKPVVRVNTKELKLARTPVMRPQDHTVTTKTVINVAPDGVITGVTSETATGVLAGTLRFGARNAQNLGREVAAQRQLQLYMTPGTGEYDFGNTEGTNDPVLVKGSFSLNDRFIKLEPSNNRATIPFGIPLLVRPGNFLLVAGWLAAKRLLSVMPASRAKTLKSRLLRACRCQSRCCPGRSKMRPSAIDRVSTSRAER